MVISSVTKIETSQQLIWGYFTFSLIIERLIKVVLLNIIAVLAFTPNGSSSVSICLHSNYLCFYKA